LLDSNDNAGDRYNALHVKASACDECGICEERCPFDEKLLIE
jgi:ferredoxin